jgi:demethylmenaquinone methyltransferase/2-methoxy-6-polyprenyl-1,4-benzoquinol methylase
VNRTRSTRTDPLPRGDDKARAVREMFDRVAGRYDVVNRVMTLGLDVGWRRRAVRELRLPGRSRVVDLACGTGDLCRELRARGYRPVGVDFSLGMLARNASGVPLVAADVLLLPLGDGSVDGATCGFALRNVTDLAALFAEAARVVRPGGRVAFLETSRPDNPVVRSGHALYFERVVPIVGGLLSDREAYRYLPRSMAYLPPPHELLEMVAARGFPDARRTTLGAGAAQLIVGTRS